MMYNQLIYDISEDQRPYFIIGLFVILVAILFVYFIYEYFKRKK